MRHKMGIAYLQSCILFSALFLAQLFSVEAADARSSVANSPQKLVNFRGRLTIDDPSVSLASTLLRVNGTDVAVAEDGRFGGAVAESDIYQLRASGKKLFTSIQTFAHAELTNAGASGLAIPSISLVSKRRGRVELVFGGDVMMGRRYEQPRWNEPTLIHPQTVLSDMTQLTTSMKPYFETSDFASVNLETVLATSDPGEYAPKSIVFYTHSNAARALKSMGVDYVTFGNNHIYDYLDSGVRTTVDAVDAAGLAYSGGGLNQSEALAPHLRVINGQDYAFIGFVGWKGRVDPDQVAGEDKGGAAYGSQENIEKATRQASDGSRVVVAQYHGSREYSEGPTAITERRMRAAIDSGADLVVGHHPHVSQGLELYNGKLIAWSLGNVIFDQFFYETHGTFVLKVWMDGDEFYRAEVIPIHIRNYKPLPAIGQVREYVLKRLTRLSADRGTTVSRSGGHGVIERADNKRSNALAPSNMKQSVSGNRNGHDLFFRGDFESYALDQKRDRSWQVKNATLTWVKKPHSGRYALSLNPSGSAGNMQLGFKTFFRVLKEEDMRFEGWFKPDEDMTVTAFAQYRPRGMNRYKALAEASLISLGTAKLKAGDWQKTEFDFKNLRAEPDKPPLPVRVLLEFEQSNGINAGSLLIDDVKLLELDRTDKSGSVSH